MSKKDTDFKVVFSDKKQPMDKLLAQKEENDKKIADLNKEWGRLHKILRYVHTEETIDKIEEKIEELETQVEKLEKENKKREREWEALSNKSTMENEWLLRGKWPRNKN